MTCIIREKDENEWDRALNERRTGFRDVGREGYEHG